MKRSPSPDPLSFDSLARMRTHLSLTCHSPAHPPGTLLVLLGTIIYSQAPGLPSSPSKSSLQLTPSKRGPRTMLPIEVYV